MKKVAIVGWRGMVGSVLMERMTNEGDLNRFQGFLFSTSLKGQPNSWHPDCHPLVMDSDSIDQLREMDIVLTCQGGEYTKSIQPGLRKTGWQGYWIDASSALRMDEDAVIVLDPVNKNAIDQAIGKGMKNFVGGNCTVSLLLLALGGLFEEDLVEWVSTHTYQAASGAGAQNMIELLEQSSFISRGYEEAKSSAHSTLELEKAVSCEMKKREFPKNLFGAPLAYSLIPWIDQEMPEGRTREEWKAQAEANKILGSENTIPIDGTCVRIGSLRCHSQALTIKLRKKISVARAQDLISGHNEWVRIVPNEKEATLSQLSPSAVSGTLSVPVGRVRHMSLGESFMNAFTVGDQLLWGAAEPLRRMLRILVD